jgi:hypothetical protein
LFDEARFQIVLEMNSKPFNRNPKINTWINARVTKLAVALTNPIQPGNIMTWVITIDILD